MGEILSWANEFVPADAGSILLDDPLPKQQGEGDTGKLYIVACFGKIAGRLVGTPLPDDVGIAGRTYKCGESYFCEDVGKDENFLSLTSRDLEYDCRSIICVPIRINLSVIGVIELINRRGRKNFDRKDLGLLEIFAGYTATVIQNALDARRFEEMSKTDYLTGLYNYQYIFRLLVQEVERAVNKGTDVAQIFFDLDSLKSVNDTYGHLVGSQILIEVAGIMREVFMDSGAAMARYGGDEYMIVLPGTPIKKAAQYAESLMSAIAEHTFICKEDKRGGTPLRIRGVITSSIGVASLRRNVNPGHSAEAMAEMLTKAADNAMYRAKGLGKNRVSIAEDCL